MNILFVCSANKIRSLTAEMQFSELYPEHNFQSAGTNPEEVQKSGGTMLTEDLMEWADVVYVMQKKHKDIINKHSNKKYGKKITVLAIKDIYDFGQKELKQILKKKVKIPAES